MDAGNRADQIRSTHCRASTARPGGGRATPARTRRDGTGTSRRAHSDTTTSSKTSATAKSTARHRCSIEHTPPDIAGATVTTGAVTAGPGAPGATAAGEAIESPFGAGT